MNKHDITPTDDDDDNNDVIQAFEDNNKMARIYAEQHFGDLFHEDPKVVPKTKHGEESSRKFDPENDIWVSPSDVLIGKVDLYPPFTSKVTRGITHKGICDIGEDIMIRERKKFLDHLTQLLAENDDIWKVIQEQEKPVIEEKVRKIYERIFQRKSKLMQKECASFFEDTLRDMEHHIRTEALTVLMSAHTSMISDLSAEINQKLEKERVALDQILKARYDGEIEKLKRYYHLLLVNEKHRSNLLINKALFERNQTLNIFCKKADNEATISSMYVMSTERKKCKMKQFLVETIHSKEVEEKLKELKEKQDLVDELNKNKKTIPEENKEWEEKVQKILKLFLKFISFTLKILPEQTSFLLDLEKLVVLQMNEIEKSPTETPQILIDEDDLSSLLQLEEQTPEEPVCEQPLIVTEGNLSSTTSTTYGSQDTIPFGKELDYFRLQRKYIYAKCGKMQQVRDYLESLRCKCDDPLPREPSPVPSSSTSTPTPPEPQPQPSSPPSSVETFIVDIIDRLSECPDLACSYMRELPFPNLDDYFDFTEEKLLRVDTILGKPAEFIPGPEIIDPLDFVNRDLPFSVTKEQYRDAETQASSVEDLTYLPECTCGKTQYVKPKKVESRFKREQDELANIFERRKKSLEQLFHAHPNLMKILTEENGENIL